MKLKDFMEVCTANYLTCEISISKNLCATINCNTSKSLQLEELVLAYGDYCIGQIDVDAKGIYLCIHK